MEFRYRIVEAEDLIKVDTEGTIDMANTVRVAREIAAFDCPQPILVDARKIQGRLSTLDIVEFVKGMVAESARYRRKLAVLVRPGDQLERARFLETYSRNRGIPIAAFVEYEEAVKWLNGQ